MKGQDKSLLIFTIIFLVISLLLFSCDNLFPTEEYKPSGSPFSLNPGIELLGIKSSDTLYSPCGAFTLEFRVRASSEKKDTLPAGLFFLSAVKAKKDMIIVKDFSFLANPSEKTFVLPVFGVQRRREIPSGSEYQLGPITDDPDLRQVIAILKRKRIEGGNLLLVQSAIYRITDGEALTPGLVDTLNALPDE